MAEKRQHHQQRHILVLGGTGTTGRRVAARLRALGHPVRIGSRTGEPVRFDWTDRATWGPALDGIDAVYVVPHEGERLTRPFLALAEKAGVRRAVLLSGRGVDVPDYMSDGNPSAITHLDGDAAIRETGLEWTVVRPSWFAQNFSEGFFADAVRSGELPLAAAEGAVPFVDAEDIADVVVAALTEEGHQGRTYELSGPRLLTFAEAAAVISVVSGRPLRYVPLTPEEYTAGLVSAGVPAEEAVWFADSLSPVRRGIEAHLSDGVREALGREPRDFTAFAADAAEAGAWG
ncbi:SDR family oxidoreductase [Streptomyces qinzhouensis]|uniref:SDR family oxidoreductase n=1 Tax=Streptomyces qinzhouensis TaxID=2599401 RepID=A0A5B8J6J3_9ACTN|nr:SDR family oxidoreductase [Streptomyces qinzhouensis]QDY76947.1 SDR family oxidoreductase [Streptomyces qinzhouensis]